MAEWGPDTPWRQGQVFTAETAAELGLGAPDNAPEALVLVISHDCDLAYSDLAAEPYCEVIVGSVIDREKIEGRYTEAKNPRRLHLTFSAGAIKLAGDFLASKRRFVDKASMPPRYLPCTSVRLTPDELSALQRWLAARYRRSSFPTEFTKRLEPIRDKLGKIIDRTGGNITGIYFSVDKNHDIERNGEEDIYELTIVLLGNSQRDPVEVTKSIGAARSQIRDLFRREYKAGDKVKSIELLDCHPSSDEIMTIADSWRLREWKT